MRKLVVISCCLFCHYSLFGQESGANPFFISGGVSYSNPLGEIELIRGARKVVRTRFSNSPSYMIKFGRRINSGSELSVSVGYANYTYENKEDYTDGFKNYSSDDFNFIPLFINYDLLFDLGSWRGIFGGHTGVVFYGKEVNLLSELHLLNIPQDQWPSHPNELTPLDLEIQNSFGIGIHGGARRDFLEGKMYVQFLFSMTYSQFVAKILNDPEDDGDKDVELDTNPIDLGIHIGMRF